MKSKEIKQLQAAVFEIKKVQHPSVPPYAIPKPSYEDKTANGLTKCIIDHINFCEPCAYAFRVSNAPTYDVKKKVHRSGNVTKGVADISAIKDGRAYQIEVKAGSDKLRPEQKVFGSRVKEAGGVFMVARSYADFLKQWQGVELKLPFDDL